MKYDAGMLPQWQLVQEWCEGVENILEERRGVSPGLSIFGPIHAVVQYEEDGIAARRSKSV